MSKKIRASHFTTLIFAALIAAAVLQGCASVTLAPPEEDAKAKVMQPAPDRALVYVYREGFIASGITFKLTLDNFLVGGIRSDQYYLLDLAPKKYKLIAESENTTEREVDLQAGHTYYFRLVPGIGFIYARVGIVQAEDGEGKQAVADAKLIRFVKL
jgi:Protein of unknown function (DUF2846)